MASLSELIERVTAARPALAAGAPPLSLSQGETALGEPVLGETALGETALGGNLGQTLGGNVPLSQLPLDQLIYDDGEPLETFRHRLAMEALIKAIEQATRDRTDVYVGGNMFIYFSDQEVFNRDFRGPDVFAVVGGINGRRERKGWVLWDENWRYPDFIVELLSESTARIDRTLKKTLYEQTFKTRNYFVYDPYDPSQLAGWRLNAAGVYEPMVADDRGWLWSDVLGLWLGAWQGRMGQHPPERECFWLRLFDANGNVIPIPEERAEAAAQQAEAERQRAETERQRADRLSRQLNQAALNLLATGLSAEQVAAALALPLAQVQSLRP